MAKDNLFLGTARGAVGDVVFSRSGGHQVSRVRNRAPRNPQTAIQLMQRVIMKTAMSSYSMFRELTDHSFQGANGKTANQSAFVKRNIDEMRKELAQLIEQNDPSEIMESTDFNFSSKQMSLPVLRPYVVSSGSLPSVATRVIAAGFNLSALYEGVNWDISAQTSAPAFTYQQLVDALGLQAGDQLTFIYCYIDDTDEGAEMNDFRFSRVILAPDDGDMTKPFLKKEAADTNYTVNSPNSRNQGEFHIGAGATITGMTDDDEYTAGGARTLVAFGVIVSRLNGGVWQRSTCQLTTRSNSGVGATTCDHETGYLGNAIWSYLNDANSSLYLNQAQG